MSDDTARMTLPFFEGALGHWLLTGEVGGHPIEQHVIIEPELDGRYLRIQYLPSTIQPTDEPYAAVAIVGREGDTYRYSLFDAYTPGAGPVGVGIPDGDALTFVFDYPDGPFRTTFRRVADGWDIDLVGASGPFATKRLRQPRMRKAWAYITDGERLLVLRHLDQPMHLSGLQVPSGTLEDGETPEEGVLREATEETGREDLEVVRPLGQRRLKWGYSDSDIFAFQLRMTGVAPERFEHGEFTNPITHRFGYSWLHVLDAETMISENQLAFLPELKRALSVTP